MPACCMKMHVFPALYIYIGLYVFLGESQILWSALIAENILPYSGQKKKPSTIAYVTVISFSHM
jgi:hypothetical protein